MKGTRDAHNTLIVALRGPAVQEGRIALADLADFGKNLQHAVFRVAAVLLGEATSLKTGPIPGQITDTCTLEVVAIERGSVSLSMRLRRSDEPTLLEVPGLGDNALEHLVEGLPALDNPGAPLPAGYDTGVLCSWRDAATIFRRGVDAVTFELGNGAPRRTARFSRRLNQRIAARLVEPVPNRRSVEGRLLMGDFKETGYQCRIYPPVGGAVTCTFDEPHRDVVLSALTKRVRVIGEATETHGRIGTLKIADIEPLEDTVSAPLDETAIDFEQSPHVHELAAHQGVVTGAGFDSLLGDFWPEEENLDDFVTAVRTWRQEAR